MGGGTLAKLPLGFRQRDVKPGFTGFSTCEQKPERYRRFASARRSFQQEDAVALQTPGEDVVQAGNAECRLWHGVTEHANLRPEFVSTKSIYCNDQCDSCQTIADWK